MELNITGKLEQALNELMEKEWPGPKPSIEDAARAMLADRINTLGRYYGTRSRFGRRDVAELKRQYDF